MREEIKNWRKTEKTLPKPSSPCSAPYMWYLTYIEQKVYTDLNRDKWYIHMDVDTNTIDESMTIMQDKRQEMLICRILNWEKEYFFFFKCYSKMCKISFNIRFLTFLSSNRLKTDFWFTCMLILIMILFLSIKILTGLRYSLHTQSILLVHIPVDKFYNLGRLVKKFWLFSVKSSL